MTTPALPLPVRRAPDWVDPVLAVVVAVLAVSVFLTADVAAIDPDLHPPTPVLAVVTAVGAAGVGWRRRRPLLGLLVVTGAALAVSASWQFTGLLPYLTMLALYAVAAYGRRREAVGALVLVVIIFAGLQAIGVPDLAVVDVLTSLGFCLAAVAVGDAVRQRRGHQRELLAAAEARSEVAAQAAVAEERLRIARELHDVVAHSMSLIAVQAGVGAHLLHRDPAAAQQALSVIAETSRTALTQTRSVVGLLRSGDDAAPSLPGLASLEGLVDGVRDAGVAVALTVDGVPREVPAVVDLAAYRVVQESLTNAVKHAPGCAVQVLVRFGPSEVQVEVRGAPGGPAASGEPGFGLLGLQERARAVGGRVRSGPAEDGGFRVRATLPTGDQA